MKKYKFLLKPMFYISSLLFSSLMVLKIEKLSPSDLGKYKALFGSGEIKSKPIPDYNKNYLKKVCSDYKAGKIDTMILDQQLQIFLDSIHIVPKNEKEEIVQQKMER